MAIFAPFFAKVQATAVASAIAQSSRITGGLSATHLIGLALVMGGALLSNLRLLGLLFPQRPAAEVTSLAGRAVLAGLLVSVTTGVMLFSARASDISSNGTFQLKMALLAAAAVVQFAVVGRSGRGVPSASRLRVTGAVGLALWFGVAFAGCAFILFE